MRELANKVLNKGIYNAIDAELIPKEASSRSLGWRTVKDHIELTRGRLRVGNNTTGTGAIFGEYIGYSATGTRVHLRKAGTAVQYLRASDDTWVNVITGLTEGEDVSFAPYVSLSGNFVIVGSRDGLWKIHLGSPQTAIDVYDSSINYKGFLIINEARAFLWNVEADLTGLYLSNIDEGNYTTVASETIGTGDGSDLSWAGTLAAKTASALRNIFGLVITAKTAATTAITAITQASNALVTSTAHGLVVGDKVLFAAVVGMTQINGLVGTVKTVPNANSFTVDIDSRAFTAYSSGGTAQRVEVFTESFGGVMTSNKGGTGTVDYSAGTYSVVFIQAPLNAVAITAAYQWENSNDGGVTDFSYTQPNRQAGEGDVFRQDIGGDRIVNVEVHEGSYFSIKERSVYRLTLSADDLTATNEVFRTGIGMPHLRASKATSKGIVFLNTANPEKPQLSIIQRNITGDNLEAVDLVPQFDLSPYDWSKCVMETHGETIVFAGRTTESTKNDVLFEYNALQQSIDILPFHVNTLVSDAGELFGGDSISDNVYQLLSGFDDDGHTITNYWEGNEELYGTEDLKKLKRVRFGGDITPDLQVDVYVSYDDFEIYNLVGTIDGQGAYIDTARSYLVAETEVGVEEVGGDGEGVLAAPFLLEMRVGSPKFRKRKWKFIARGLGHVKMKMIHDWDIMLFDSRLPRQNRVKAS